MASDNRIYKEVYINSADRTSGTSSSNFTITFPYDIEFAEVRLVSARIPHTWYNVNDGNNHIDFDEGGGELNATVTAGQYTTTQLAAAVKTALEAAGALTYTVTFDTSTTFKTTIAATGNFSLLFGSGTNKANDLAAVLGFSATDTTSAASAVSDGVYNLNNIGYILIQSDTLGTSRYNNVSCTNTLDNAKSTLAAIRVNTNFGSMQSFSDDIQFPSMAYLAGPIYYFNLKLQYEGGKSLSLNGQEWECILQVNLQSIVKY